MPSPAISQNPIENYPLPILAEEGRGGRQSNGVAPVGNPGSAAIEDACYFCACGERDRKRLEGRIA
jgi:hypothetical protein